MLIETPASITPRCFALGSRFFPVFYLGTHPPILVEGGVSSVVPKVLKDLEDLDLPSPRLLLLLHEHNDHVLGAPLLKERLGLEVLASAQAIQILSKEKVIKAYKEVDPFFTRVLESHGEGEESPWEEFPIPQPAQGGLLPQGLHLLPAPGHSPGSQALFWEEEGILFVSDSMGYYSSRDRHFPLYFQSLELYLQSIDKMYQTHPKTLVLGHLQYFKGEEVKSIFQRSREEALKLAQEVKRAGENAEEMVFKAIRQDELITFYTRETIQECARLLVKRSLEA